jgi:tRNA threonylcarbamoyladenosine biosynthesis protein TsaB
LKILALETTGRYGSAAVIDDDGRLWRASSSEEMNHLRGMMTLVDDALTSAGVPKDELTHIAASAGPGSFTGIRIGVTTARTMAQMLGLPCIGVSSTEALAKGALADAVSAGAGYIVPVINARRHQTYAAVFTADRETQSLEPVLGEKQYMIEDLLEELLARLKEHDGAAAYFTGDGIDAYKEIIEDAMPEGSYIFADEDKRYQRAGSVAEIALAKAGAGLTVGYDGLMPEYMRLAEAEQRLRAGTLSDRIRTAKV